MAENLGRQQRPDKEPGYYSQGSDIEDSAKGGLNKDRKNSSQAVLGKEKFCRNSAGCKTVRKNLQRLRS